MFGFLHHLIGGGPPKNPFGGNGINALLAQHYPQLFAPQMGAPGAAMGTAGFGLPMQPQMPGAIQPGVGMAPKPMDGAAMFDPSQAMPNTGIAGPGMGAPMMQQPFDPNNPMRKLTGLAGMIQQLRSSGVVQ